MVEAINQGTCVTCGNDDDNYTIQSRCLGDGGVGILASCDCGTTATIAITENGLTGGPNISHEGASWNQNS